MTFASIAFAIAIALSIASLLYPVAIVPNTNPIERHNKMRTAKKAVIASLCVSILVGLLWTSISVAHYKGMQPDDTEVDEFFAGLFTTPFEDELPEDPSELMGKLIVLYRYDCPSCHYIMDDIKEALEDYPVYYVCSRSEQGNAFREQYPIMSVPCIVYPCVGIPGEHYSHHLAIKDGDGDVALDIDGLNKIVDFYEKQL